MTKYPWPCSALTDEEMKILYALRQASGIPISRVLKNLCHSAKIEQSTEQLGEVCRYVEERMEYLRKHSYEPDRWGRLMELKEVMKRLKPQRRARCGKTYQ